MKTLKNANLWVFGALVVAEFRIRQLWITRTLDDEANRFKGSNEALRREIQDLTTQNTSLSDEMVPLKKQVAALGEEEVRLRQDILRMQTAESRQGEELEGFRKVLSGLNRGEGAVDSDIESLQAYVAHLQGEQKRLDEVGEKVEAELQELVAGKAASLKRETALNLREEELQRREEALD